MSEGPATHTETGAATPARAEEPLGELMAGGRTPARPRPSEPRAKAATFGTSGEAEAGARRSGLRLVVLRILLVLNVAAMAAVLIVPTGTAKPDRPTPEPTEPAQGPVQGHPGAPARTGVPVFPERDSYNHALMLANEGKWVEAVTALEQYMSRNPALPSSQRRLIYLAMQHYNTQAGRTAEAEACLASAQSLLERSFLPEDLLRGASLAEKEGNGAEMRRNYARFLLLQKSLPAALREKISEAYLKLGDSYRVEADSGERKAEAELESQRQRLRSKEGAGALEGRK